MPDPEQDDLTAEADHMVRQTPNGQKPGDPDNIEVSQDPNWLPEGTETEAGQ